MPGFYEIRCCAEEIASKLWSFSERELEDILLAAVCSRLTEVVARPGFVVHAHADGPFHVVEAGFFLVLELSGDESDAYVWVSPTTPGEFPTVDVVYGCHSDGRLYQDVL
jgi:hypothetical protein